MPRDKINLSIIIVSFRSQKYLEDLLSSIFEKNKAGIKPEIIIVNNDQEEKLDFLKSKFNGVKIIETPQNVGFGAANNLGAKKAQGKHLLFLNPDTRIISDNFKNVLAEFEKDEKVGIIGGGLLDKEGRFQGWSLGFELNLGDLLRNNLGFPRSEKLWKEGRKQEVDWVAGTAMFVRKDLFWDLGGFDEKFFMYFEDMDLCLRAAKKGKKILYFPTFFVIHKSGESYQNKKQQKKDYYDSQEYYFRKHKGRTQAFLVKLLRRIFSR